MPRYLVEIPHQPTLAECLREMHGFMRAGVHWLTTADWGCMSGDHRAWITFEAEDDTAARRAIPPVVREKARLIALTKFNVAQVKLLENVGSFFAAGKPPADIPIDNFLGPMGQAIMDLARRLGRSPTEFAWIKIGKVERETWPDRSLGFPEPGQTYAHAATTGFRLEFLVDGKSFWYHADREHAVFAGQESGPVAT